MTFSQSASPGAAPPRMVCTRGRPRKVPTSYPFCLNPACGYYGWALGICKLMAIPVVVPGGSGIVHHGPPVAHTGKITVRLLHDMSQPLRVHFFQLQKIKIF